MGNSVTITELLANPADLVQKVVQDQQTLVLTDGDRPVAEIRPLESPKKGKTLAEVFASLPRLPPDEAEAFARDIEEGRRWLNQLPIRDPWQD